MDRMSIEEMKEAGMTGTEIMDEVLRRIHEGMEYAQVGGAVFVDTDDLQLILNYIEVLEGFVKGVQRRLDAQRDKP